MTGSDMRKSIYDMKKEPTSLSSVRLLTSEQLVDVVREGRKENPINVCDECDEELKCTEDLIKAETYSIDGLAELESASDFDADVVFTDSIDIFGPMTVSL